MWSTLVCDSQTRGPTACLPVPQAASQLAEKEPSSLAPAHQAPAQQAKAQVGAQTKQELQVWGEGEAAENGVPWSRPMGQLGLRCAPLPQEACCCQHSCLHGRHRLHQRSYL
eukprot:1141288-Pelagomonas_calceolata.AAC.6